MMLDVNELGEVGSNENLNIVAMVDRSPDYGDIPVLDVGDWVGGLVVYIQPGHGEVLQDLGQIDMVIRRRSLRSSAPASPSSRPSTTR